MTAWQKIGLLALGGSLGTICRYFVTSWAEKRYGSAFPWGTLFVNIGGSFALGLLMGIAAGRSSLSQPLRLLLCVGFMGAFTTFSTLSFDTVSLAQSGGLGRAALNLLGSAAAGLLAVWLGLQLGKAV